ncbi:hypothetical protein AQUCO_02000562v1 [Aquilegia coerulea]|uniref:SHSP domain-containing protein n=1 Tax=Aquilegia coerulea TaxID=218851 RepID=A0A2G5DI48_AQUCA|nr:hypothetical protein AQUCO_02000562v1 [Aquilegia coerulea]
MILRTIDSLKDRNIEMNRSEISKHVKSTYGFLLQINQTNINHHLIQLESTGQIICVDNKYKRGTPNPNHSNPHNNNNTLQPTPTQCHPKSRGRPLKSILKSQGRPLKSNHPIISISSSAADDVDSSDNLNTKNTSSSMSNSSSSSPAAIKCTTSPIVDENMDSIVNEPFYLPKTDDTAKNGKRLPSIPVNVLESSKDYILFCDVPGLSKADVQVTVEDAETLVIQSSGNGKRKREEEATGEGNFSQNLEKVSPA